LTISGTGDMDDWDYWTTGQAPWFQYNDDVEEIIIEEGVTSIGDEAFILFDYVTKITIPSSVTSIGYRAFYDWDSLESITITNGVTDIGSCAFEDCDDLKTVVLPDSVVSLGNGAFLDCQDLENVTLSNNLDYIGGYAFENCSALTKITIPDSVSYIGYYAFWNCTNLTDITLPDSNVQIDNYAFETCTSLKSITLPNVTLGSYVFCYCPNLAEVTISSGSIGINAFADCKALSKLTISDGVVLICSEAFSGCTGLESVTIPGSVTSYGAYMFEDCTNLKSVTIQEGAKEIGLGEFAGCTSLTDVTLPDGLETIGLKAFEGCTSLESITIPSSVVSIGKTAFDQCTSLTDVTMDKQLAATCESSGVFSGTKVSDVDYILYDIITTSTDGTVSVASTSASTDKVTLTVTPDENFVVGSVILTDNGVETVLTPDTDGQYSFVMPSNAVTVEAVYTRVKADISFCSDDGTVLQTTKYDVNAIPSYNGETPAKAETYEYSYEFAGWSDGYKTYGVGEELPAVTDDASYRAVFTEIPKPGEYYLNSIEIKDGTAVFSIKQVQNDDQTYDLVDKVISDGNELTNGNQYDLSKGSAVITLKKDYFDSLATGKHTLEVRFKDGGSITVEYTINGGKDSAKSITTASGAKVPATGEGVSTTSVIGASLIFLVLALFVGVKFYDVIVKLKKRNT